VPGRPPKAGKELRLALLFFLLGLLAKPMVVTLPVILLLLDFWPLQRVSDLKAQLPGLLREKWPFFALTVIFCGITLFAQQSAMPAQPAGSRLAGFLTDYWGYVQKIFWPENLSIVYERHGNITMANVMEALLALAGISVLAGLGWRRWPWLLVGWLWFLVMLLPVTAVTLGGLSIANRYTYLPQIGFLVMLVWGIVEAAPKFFENRAGQAVSAAVVAVILGFYAYRTQIEIGYWRNTQTIMERALKIDSGNGIAAQVLRIYVFEQKHPGVRERHHSTTR
jgi:hypothetical protein